MRDPSAMEAYVLEVKQLLKQRGALENEISELKKANLELRDKVRRLEGLVRTQSDQKSS
jgi:hypothetical protein